jgi:tetratricopeptide (TPR) repeat protein
MQRTMNELQNAIQYVYRGDLQTADQMLRRIKAKDERNFDAIHMLGVVCSELGKFDEAERFFKIALSIDSKFPPLYRNYGLFLSKTRRFQEAIDKFNIAIRLAPNFVPLYSDRGNALKRLGKLDEAISDHDRAISLSPQFFGFYNNRGNALIEKGLYLKALADFDAAIQLDPHYADAHCGRGNALMHLKRYEEAFHAHEKALSIKPNLENAWIGKGSVLCNQKQYGPALAAYDKALSINSDLADAWFGRGNVYLDLKRYDEALAAYEKALSINPDLADAWVSRGNVYSGLKRYDEALAAYDKALSINPDLSDAWVSRGNAYSDLKRYEEALAVFDEALRIDPEAAEAYLSRANTLHILGRNVEALNSLNKAVEIDPVYAEAHFNRSLVLLTLGKYAEAWEEYEWRNKVSGPDVNKSFTEPLLLNLDGIQGATVFLYGEQGFGDYIHFCRYVKLISGKGTKVILEVPKPLFQLFKSLDGVSELIEAGESIPSFDYHCSLMSLPRLFGTTLENVPNQVPYLLPESDKVKAWATRLGAKSKMRIGLVWCTGVRPNQWSGNERRNIPLAKFALLRDLDIVFYSLQKGEQAVSEFKALLRSGWNGPTITDWTDDLNDFSDTAALIENLDLVISVDTSTAHLAGAMAKPVWLLNRFDIDWRWLPNSPWYPTVKLYRQPEAGNWDQMIESVRVDLISALPGTKSSL